MSFTRLFSHRLLKQTLVAALGIFIIFGLSFTLINTNVHVQAAANTNPIKLSIPFVQVGDQKVETRYDGSYNWIFDGELSKNDLIRYSWNNAAIDLTYKTYPQAGGGWIRVYLNDDSKPENALTDHGTSPLPVSKIADRLVNGSNKILMVFVDESNDPAKSTTKVGLTFNYKSDKVLEPKITNVVEPSENAIFSENSVKNFKIELNNFSLTDGNSADPNQGQMRVYLNEVKNKPLVNIKTSKALDNNRQIVEFNSKDFDPEVKTPDQRDAKLIFALFDTTGKQLGNAFERKVILNYGSSLKDIGLPEIIIVEPKADRVDLTVDGDRKFLVETKNFELLPQLTDGSNEDRKGYLQIYVDEQPVKTIWAKTEFSLNEIGFSSKESGRKNVRLQLVNKDFTKLSPEVGAAVDIIYKSSTNIENTEAGKNDSPVVESSNWRIIIIGVIALLIVGGIIILVIKG